MKYRVRAENRGVIGRTGYRAEIGKENQFGKIEWAPIENDGYGSNLIDRVVYHDTVAAAKTACERHHVEMGYDKIGKDVVEEFER